MSAYFVTATGTDIGKTFVTAGLVRCLRGQGRRAAALKPVVSGIAHQSLAASDPGVLLEAMGEAVTEAAIARVSPWRFQAALSPDMAAAREGRSIDFAALVEFCRARAAEAEGTLFIEGVGGVLVPLDGTHTVRDWMKALGIPAIVVAGSYLGTISHTLSAMEVLDAAGIDCAALVINESVESPVPLEETRDTLARFLPAVPIALVHRTADTRKSDFAMLAKALACDLEE